MNNPMDNAKFTPAPYASQPADFQQILAQARQNPVAFEEHIKATNPQAYQQALQIRNSANPKAMVMQMAQAKGLHPNMLRMLGLM